MDGLVVVVVVVVGMRLHRNLEPCTLYYYL